MGSDWALSHTCQSVWPGASSRTRVYELTLAAQFRWNPQISILAGIPVWSQKCVDNLAVTPCS